MWGLTAGQWSIYVTLNPVDSVLLARANNRLVRYAKTTTGDPEVLRRQRMLFDFDTKRPKGIAATDQEVLAAVTRRNEAVGFLRECGWPDLWLALRRDDEVPF